MFSRRGFVSPGWSPSKKFQSRRFRHTIRPVRLLVIILLLAILSGCGTQDKRPDGPSAPEARIDRPSDEGLPEPSQEETLRQSELYAKPPPGQPPAALQPQQIALLLPFRGGYRKAAEAVRDGFIAAWHDAGDYKPALKIYDANALNVEQMYAQAVAEGADFVVGPLEKQAIEELAKLTDLPVPVLALNQAQAGSGEKPAGPGVLPSLMQFGLSPEDEARQVAQRARLDGRGRALVIVPNDPWGQRLHRAFRDAWLPLGGTVLERISYDPQSKDYSLPVRRLLNTDASEERARRLRRKLNVALRSEARLRQDADMIFMAAFPVAARQLVPQFRFHKAEGLPVYATSHVFTGAVNPQADADMNEVMFADLPWILLPRAGASSLRALVNEHFQASSAYRRLHALGVDAFHLIPHLPRLAVDGAASFAGATGLLSMAEDGMINRQLLWSRIVDGKPELLRTEGNDGR